MNAYDICAIPAAIEPERECLVGGSARLTYADLDRWTAGLALELAPHAGRRIAVLDVNTVGLVAVALACWRAGCTVVPLNVRSRGEELRYLLERCEAPLVLAGEAYVETATALSPAGVSVRRVPTPPVGSTAAEQISVDVDEKQVAVALFTSGSTSRPKLVELTHGNLMALVTESTELLGDEGAAVLVTAPLFHVAAFAAVLTGLFGGRRVVLLEEFDPERWLGALAEESVTHAFLVPTMLRRLLDHRGFAPQRLESLRILSYGAAPMPPGLLDRILELVPDSVGLVNAFGQTETTSTVTMLGPDDHRLSGSPEEIALRRKRLRSVGRAIPGVEVAILDADGAACPTGAIGEVAVRGVRNMRGYAGDDAAAAGGWLRTRDLGYLDEDGYLFLTGRGDDMMIRAGENVAPAEVEAVLLAHPSIADAAAVGIPDDDVGERIGVAVVARDGVELDVAEMLGFAAARLAAYKRPEVLAVVDELPRSPMGKIQRPRLREMVQQQGRVIERVAGGLQQ